jgi:sigma-54 dependent transcriptional regulator, acetoin dehydrogenase operon transcriptional activator AcoR
MQRDAIVPSLLDYHGSKVKTAGSPGMSRTTIYRKTHQYGIITPASKTAGTRSPASYPMR